MITDESSTSPRKERLSSSVISSQISQVSTLAATLQAVAEVRPGNISRFHNFNGDKIEDYLKSTVTLNRPIIDLATRGIMVERGFLEIDEVDLGWIIANAIKKLRNHHHVIGILLSYAPITAAAGYMQSSSQDAIDTHELRALASEFLENTTPEDADNLFTALYEMNSDRFSFINDFGETLQEGKNYMLEEEINLVDFYRLFSKESLIFEEMYNEYDFSFNKGLYSFNHAISKGLTISDAISHTFIDVLANHTPKINGSDHKLPYKLKQDAIAIIENGGYITSSGKILTSRLEEFILKHREPIRLHEIAEITSVISLIAFLENPDLTLESH